MTKLAINTATLITIAAKTPAARSSNMIPQPPPISSNRRIPKGFQTSNIRNSRNAESTDHHSTGAKTINAAN